LPTIQNPDSQLSLFHVGVIHVEGKQLKTWQSGTDAIRKIRRIVCCAGTFDFMNDESLIEYQEVVQKLMGAIGALLQNASEPGVVAEVIYQAATDGTNQLRYTDGEDAKVLVAQRKQADDATFIGGIKRQFGL
jgi:hypothetical protein